ncbi:hypothetical protein [Pseudomonas lopnurensis]|uniref:hypothetical protein n=1 Tax=Pseudomonas lopnurensis TaxID=1477517 RepID=UPI0028ADEC83|nr:hypothetical protein [Pseudomonas lopnurensis]
MSDLQQESNRCPIEALIEHCLTLATEIANTHAAHRLQAALKEDFVLASSNG